MTLSDKLSRYLYRSLNWFYSQRNIYHSNKWIFEPKIITLHWFFLISIHYKYFELKIPFHAQKRHKIFLSIQESAVMFKDSPSLWRKSLNIYIHVVKNGHKYKGLLSKEGTLLYCRKKTFNMKDCPLELMIRINVLIKTLIFSL